MTGAVTAEWSAENEELANITQRALLFQSHGTTYGISVDFVSKVIEIDVLTEVPGAPPWLLGSTVFEFLPYPLIDPARLLQHNRSGSELITDSLKPQRAIVIKSAHGRVLLAVERLVTIAELTAHMRVNVERPEFPVAFMEYVCRAEEKLIGVISIPKLLQAAVTGESPALAAADSAGRSR